MTLSDDMSAARARRVQALKDRTYLAEQARLDAIRQQRDLKREAERRRFRDQRLVVLDARLGDWRARIDAQIDRCPLCDTATVYRHAHEVTA
jgi:hypothetical protein